MSFSSVAHAQRRKRRAIFFFDGFNFYHSLVDGIERHHFPKKYKWVNLWKLATRVALDDDEVTKVLYFTAYCTWDDDKKRRHQAFVKALEAHGVEVKLGEFRTNTLHVGGRQIPIREEKRTDVNIAVWLLRLGFQDCFDSAYLVSGDSDFIPLMESFFELFPRKRFVVAFPYNRSNKQVEKIVRANGGFIRHIRESDIRKSLFDKVIALTDESRIVCPPEWWP